MNVCLIGYGYAGKTFHAPLITHSKNLTLATVVSSKPQLVKAQYKDAICEQEAEAAFRNAAIDLVVIATPNQTHFPLAKAALKHGKHVVVDKPFTTTTKEASELLQLATEQGKIITIFQNRRLDADFLTLKKLIASDVLGEIHYLESHFDRYRLPVQKRWREEDVLGGGLWFDLGPHLLDQALVLFGKPDSLMADLAKQRPGAQTTDYFHVVLKYGDRRVILHASAYTGAPAPRFTMHGKLGSYIKFGLDKQEDALKQGIVPTDPKFAVDNELGVLTVYSGGEKTEKRYANLPGGYISYYDQVHDAILGLAETPVSGKDALSVMNIIEAAIESSKSGAQVRI